MDIVAVTHVQHQACAAVGHAALAVILGIVCIGAAAVQQQTHAAPVADTHDPDAAGVAVGFLPQIDQRRNAAGKAPFSFGIKASVTGAAALRPVSRNLGELTVGDLFPALFHEGCHGIFIATLAVDQKGHAPVAGVGLGVTPGEIAVIAGCVDVQGEAVGGAALAGGGGCVGVVAACVKERSGAHMGSTLGKLVGFIPVVAAQIEEQSGAQYAAALGGAAVLTGLVGIVSSQINEHGNGLINGKTGSHGAFVGVVTAGLDMQECLRVTVTVVTGGADDDPARRGLHRDGITAAGQFLKRRKFPGKLCGGGDQLLAGGKKGGLVHLFPGPVCGPDPGDVLRGGGGHGKIGQSLPFRRECAGAGLPILFEGGSGGPEVVGQGSFCGFGQLFAQSQSIGGDFLLSRCPEKCRHGFLKGALPGGRGGENCPETIVLRDARGKFAQADGVRVDLFAEFAQAQGIICRIQRLGVQQGIILEGSGTSLYGRKGAEPAIACLLQCQGHQVRFSVQQGVIGGVFSFRWNGSSGAADERKDRQQRQHQGHDAHSFHGNSSVACWGVFLLSL